jgi:hypothetical protein
LHNNSTTNAPMHMTHYVRFLYDISYGPSV